MSSALLLGPAGEAEPSRFAVGAATLSLLARAAEDVPLAVLVDDAHLLDVRVRGGARLRRPTAGLRRDRDPGQRPRRRAGIGAVGHAADTDRPRRWTSGRPQELVTWASGPVRPEQMVRLHRATAGNPLGLLELGDRVDRARRCPAGVCRSRSPSCSPGRSWAGPATSATSARTALLVAAADGASAVHRLRGLRGARPRRATAGRRRGRRPDHRARRPHRVPAPTGAVRGLRGGGPGHPSGGAPGAGGGGAAAGDRPARLAPRGERRRSRRGDCGDLGRGRRAGLGPRRPCDCRERARACGEPHCGAPLAGQAPGRCR